MIKGISVILTEKIFRGKDNFNNPIYDEFEEIVDNVLVGEPSVDEIVANEKMYGTKITYILAIPKGDEHIWNDTTVKFFGHTFKTVGDPIQGIEENIPLNWNKKIRVAKYD